MVTRAHLRIAQLFLFDLRSAPRRLFDLAPRQRAEAPESRLERRQAIAVLAKEGALVGKALDECELRAEVYLSDRDG